MHPLPSSSTVGVPLGRPGWTLLIAGAATNGAFELFEERRDVIGGPPRHVHRDRAEAFYILEGRYAFERDGEPAEVGPGEVVLVPRGSPHVFRTLSAPARTLILVSPAGLEAFFREMGERIGAGSTPLEAMTALSVTHDSHPVP